MRISDTFWTPKINVLLIKCDCENLQPMETDKWKIKCSRCGKEIKMNELRREYCIEKGIKT